MCVRARFAHTHTHTHTLSLSLTATVPLPQPQLSALRWTTYPLITWLGLTFGGRTYESECTRKILSLPNSRLADELRRRLEEYAVPPPPGSLSVRRLWEQPCEEFATRELGGYPPPSLSPASPRRPSVRCFPCFSPPPPLWLRNPLPSPPRASAPLGASFCRVCAALESLNGRDRRLPLPRILNGRHTHTPSCNATGKGSLFHQLWHACRVIPQTGQAWTTRERGTTICPRPRSLARVCARSSSLAGSPCFLSPLVPCALSLVSRSCGKRAGPFGETFCSECTHMLILDTYLWALHTLLQLIRTHIATRAFSHVDDCIHSYS